MQSRAFRASIVRIEGGRRPSGPLSFAALVVFSCLAVRFTSLDHAGVSFCYFKALTHHACLTCGSTRAFGLLGRFDVPGALAIQPLVTVGALVLMAWGLLDVVLLVAGKRTLVRIEERPSRILALGVVALAILNWAYLLAAGV